MAQIALALKLTFEQDVQQSHRCIVGFSGSKPFPFRYSAIARSASNSDLQTPDFLPCGQLPPSTATISTFFDRHLIIYRKFRHRHTPGHWQVDIVPGHGCEWKLPAIAGRIIHERNQERLCQRRPEREETEEPSGRKRPMLRCSRWNGSPCRIGAVVRLHLPQISRPQKHWR